MPILKNLASALTGKITPDIAQTRLAEAEAHLAKAREAFELAAMQSAESGDPAPADAAERAVHDAEKAVTRAEAVLRGAHKQEGERERAARVALEAKQDAKLDDALTHRAAITAKLTKSAAAFTNDFAAFVHADHEVKALGMSNPRVRHDIFTTPASHRVADELARIVGDGIAPPTANAKARLFGNPADLPSLVSEIATETAVIREGLHHVV